MTPPECPICAQCVLSKGLTHSAPSFLWAEQKFGPGRNISAKMIHQLSNRGVEVAEVLDESLLTDVVAKACMMGNFF